MDYLIHLNLLFRHGCNYQWNQITKLIRTSSIVNIVILRMTTWPRHVCVKIASYAWMHILIGKILFDIFFLKTGDITDAKKINK